MRCSDVRIWLSGLLRPLSRSSSGASLLWVIAAITIVGGFAAAITTMTPSSMQGRFSGERGSRAYYAALSGVEFFKGLQDSERDAFKAKSNAERTITFGEDRFFVTNIASDSENWYIDVVGSSLEGGKSVANYILSNRSIARTTMKTTPILEDKFDSIVEAVVDSVKVRMTDDSSATNNDGFVKGSSTSGVVVDSNAIQGNSYKFASSYRGRVVHEFVEDYNIFYKGTIMVFLYPTNTVNDYAGLVHKGISKFVCSNGIFTDEVYTLQFWPSGKYDHVFKMFLIEGNENTSCTKTDKACLCAGSGAWKYVEASSVTTVAANKWQHVAITWEQKKSGDLDMKFYINGSLDNTVPVKNFTPRRNQADLVIGGQSDDDSGDVNTFYNGNMDNLSIYNRALSGDEIKTYFIKTRTDYCKGSHSGETMCKATP